jgi:hypothetical protein
MVFQKFINFLEFLASSVDVLLAASDGEVTARDCLLCITDNTSSAGWLRKSNPPQRKKRQRLILAWPGTWRVC